MKKINDFNKAIIQQIFVATIWGGGWVAAHFVTHEIPAFTAAGWQIIIVIISLGFLVLKQHKCLPKISQKNLTLISAMGIIGIFGYNICFFYGLKYVLPGRAALVVALTPALVAIASSLFTRTLPTGKMITGVLIGIIGCLIVIAKGNPLTLLEGGIGLGECIILSCALAWTIYTLIGKCVDNTVSPLVTSFYASSIGGILLWIVGLFEGSLLILPNFSIKLYSCLLYLGVLASGLCYVWYANGIKVLGTTRTAAFSNFVPVSAVLLSSFILQEKIILTTLFGGVLILIGVILTNLD
ncbi:MAG: EamA family transporter [Pseudomonadota bacterium]